MNIKTQLIQIILRASETDTLKKIVFSRPAEGLPQKQSGRLCVHGKKKYLAFEATENNGKVSHVNIEAENSESSISDLIDGYSQVNLITSAGNAEYKRNKKGNEVLLGGSALLKALSLPISEDKKILLTDFDRQKKYILNGKEPFLKFLAVSDENGRVHDKKQGKFRQINRFIEHIDDIYGKLSSEGKLTVYDLCCGKSYLSFAVYYYLRYIKNREVDMLCIDLKSDVIEYCSSVAASVGFDGMKFICDDVRNTPHDIQPDLVISLHACDIATDIVINHGAELKAKVILSTPCCHHYLNSRISAPELSFVSSYGQLRNKLCEALTDGLRLLRLRYHGYDVTALELTDPDDTPKNTLLRAIFDENYDIHSEEAERRLNEYNSSLSFVLGEDTSHYLEEIK